MVSISGIVVAVVVLILLHRTYAIIYNLYFSPLARFPGPTTWSISKLPYLTSLIRGQIHVDTLALHKRYGSVVRVGPKQLAFFTARSFKDLYGRTGSRNFQKDGMYYQLPVNGVVHLVAEADEVAHTRQRRLLAGGFTVDALRSQEKGIMGYVNLLMEGLERESISGPLDLGAWFNYTTFDITGDLMFGEDFGCLRGSRLHPWIKLTFTAVKALTWLIAAKQYPLLNSVLMKLIPRRIIQQGVDHFNMSAEKVDRRIAMGTDRPDFMSVALRNGFSEVHGPHLEKEKVLSRAELHSTAYMMIIAGSETSATALSGICFYLCKNPRALQQLGAEIRSTFASDADITFTSSSKLAYLNAVIEEGLRVHPPVPWALKRLPPPGGEMVDGHFVPEGTSVATYHYPTYHSPSNFHLPDEFIPERWLGSDPRFVDDKLEAVQPFNMGPTGCLGKVLGYTELRVIIAKLLFRFDIILSRECDDWANQDCNFVWDRLPLMVRLYRTSTSSDLAIPQ